MTRAEILTHPALDAVERLLILCSDYDLVSKEQLCQAIRQLDGIKDWRRLHDLALGHQLVAYPWYQFKGCADQIDSEIRRLFEADDAACRQEDVRQATWVEQLSPLIAQSGIPFAVLKGPLLQQWLYQGRDIPRGASDIDLLVFGGMPSLKRIIPIIESSDFTFKSYRHFTWQQEFVISHDLLFTRPSSDPEIPFKLELHHAPSVYHLRGRDSRSLMQWLETQRTQLPWRSPWPHGPAQLPF